jgi:beta-ribofuranosylaminobenzene 5'-phosphate synthase
MKQERSYLPGDLPDCTTLLQAIENETGPIPDAVKALLITDGSVTNLLECFSGSPVTIRTISQQVIPALPDIAEEMQISAGDPINYRVVGIFDTTMDIPLIHAISYCPVHRLPDHARNSLMKADIPIGHILRDEKMESRREITGIRTVRRGEIPSCCPVPGPGERLFARHYKIIHQNLPLFRIEEFVPDTIFPGTERMEIRTPSRLHLTLIDMNGSLGRVDGGIGITLDRPGYVISAEPAEGTRVISDDDELGKRIMNIISLLSTKHGYNPGMIVRVREAIPMHCGLGSGTQLSLAIATAMMHLSKEKDPDQDPARLTGRGGTSGIGVKAFSDGGVIVDGGHRMGPGQEKESFLPSSASQGVRPPPLIGRYPFPEDWRIILCLPHIRQGANGPTEQNIFQRCCPVPLQEVQELSHIILMQMIPALIDRDIDQFGRSVSAIGKIGFKREELALQPPVLHDLLHYMDTCGSAGAGMSSFGPVLYALTDTNGAGLASDIRSYLKDHSGGEVRVVRGRNNGAIIRAT